MTIREFMNAVIAIDNAPAEVKDFALGQIEKLDASNAKRAEKPSKRAIENEPIKIELYELLKELGGVHTSSAVVEILEGKYSVQKVSSLCRQLVKDGKLEVSEVKVKGKGVQKGYSAVVEE